MSRINEDKMLNNSVHEFGSKGKAGDLSLHDISISGTSGGHINPGGQPATHNHSKSLMKSPANLEELSLNLPDKKKEILEKKRYEQMQKNYN